MVDSGASSCTRPVMLPTSASVRGLPAGISLQPVLGPLVAQGQGATDGL
jgi:hypothetical protein